jgi:L-lactate dehydrogenase complex protein LldE
MSLPERESPAGKRVSFFVTCIVDMVYPETGLSAVDILEHFGVAVDFPMAQTCCGQPGFNSGYRKEARQVARQFMRAFADAEVIVTPSGSCAAMVRHEYPNLFKDDPDWLPKAQRAAEITWEISEFLVEGLGITDLKGKLPKPESFAFHDACHGLRLLGLGPSSRKLLENIENATVHELKDCDVCCGFGGLFSVKMADVSGDMLQRKIDNIKASDADTIITGDASCLTHMNGGLSRQNAAKQVRHLVDVLAEAIKNEEASS